MLPPHIDIVARLREIAAAGSRSDQRLAAEILADPDFATHAAIALLAKRAEVSEPTVTRFCRALGCAGLRDFKVRLAQAVATTGRYIKPVGEGREGARVPQIIATAAHGAIEAVCAGIDVAALARAADLIVGARMVRAYGSGGSSSLAAVELENRLFRLGVLASAHVDGEMQQMTAAAADSSTVIVAYSVSGEVRSVIDAVATARLYGASAIAFTAPDSPLAAAASLALPFRVDEGTDIFRPTPARYALLALTDMLALSVAERIGAPAVERMRRIKHHQGLNKRDATRLPLGD
ncbi:MurR/RpiR family transcriptional regulator [Methylocapsa sp. S129]|uniref:MurR/RpiR family transcriptional regulator n=1 Tax=Methylocapsa sp. S129 TaxID=1641869 RepID=UPI00131E7A8E|nr:MurR/RpiR family transcriptional regulator [Methylocapsa sp. S129]